MKKFLIVIAIIAIISLAILFFGFRKAETPYSNVSGTKLSTNINVSNENSKNATDNTENNEESNTENTNENNSNPQFPIELSSYTTEIKDNSSGRLTNISITCSALNGKIIHNGETFSFNNTVGKPTSQRGYQEADVIINKKLEKGIGGGNCQVSSTLYNAVLAIQSLTVVERNEHGLDVTYVPEGKDACVSYGSLDFKFQNNTGRDIQINASTDNKTITTSLIQL